MPQLLIASSVVALVAKAVQDVFNGGTAVSTGSRFLGVDTSASDMDVMVKSIGGASDLYHHQMAEREARRAAGGAGSMTDREIKAATANRVHKAAKSRVMAALQGIDLKDDSCFGYKLSRRNKKCKLYNHYKEEEKKKTNMEALHEVLRGGALCLRIVPSQAMPILTFSAYQTNVDVSFYSEDHGHNDAM